jgi:predicted SAM-dependent methyltransferase
MYFNQSKTKLEIGVGNNPQKDVTWIHQDIRQLSEVDLVCDAKKLPIDNNSLTDIFASHVIEHFGWRNVRDVLVEWLRVLKVGGKLEIITPDFYRLWENLVIKRDLPKTDKWRGGPVDSAFVAYVTGGGQDYIENTHTAHYTPDWYKETLEKLGCTVEVKYHGQNHPSPSVRIIAIKL